MFRNKFLFIINHYRVDVGNLIFIRNAGHNKWSNIKHIKGANDQQKSMMFQKFSRLMKLAIREQNDSNPETNSKLASVIEMAKKNSMPKDTILNALKTHSTSKAELVWFEIKGPKGAILLVQGLTDNPKLLKQNLNTVVRKSGLAYCDSGAKHLFVHQGVIIAKPPSDMKDAKELCVEHAIEAGAEEVETDDEELEPGYFKFICEPNTLNKVRSKLESYNYEIIVAEEDHIAQQKVVLNEVDSDYINKFISNLETLPDIHQTYSNIA